MPRKSVIISSYSSLSTTRGVYEEKRREMVIREKGLYEKRRGYKIRAIREAVIREEGSNIYYTKE